MFNLKMKKVAQGKEAKRIYLDYASATPVLPEVLAKMLPYFTESFGNASAIHDEGMVAKRVVNECREKVARLLVVQSDQVTFTSGGTESNNLAILGTVQKYINSGSHYSGLEIITTKIEHPATIKTVEYLEGLGVAITYAPVDNTGKIILNELTNLLSEKTVLVSVAYVNSEIGTIQDVGAIARIIAKTNKQNNSEIKFHIDGAQAPLWLPCDLPRLGCDMISLDSGKFGGGKGVGVLARKRDTKISNINYGGGQEGGLRPGTESVAGIVGFTEALQIVQSAWQINTENVSDVRDYFIKKVQTEIPNVSINGAMGSDRVANNVNISIPGIDSEFAVVVLDNKGIACSTKSACSSSGGGESTVVKEISGDQARAMTTLRFTLGTQTTKTDIDTVVEVLKNHVSSIPKFN